MAGITYPRNADTRGYLTPALANPLQFLAAAVAGSALVAICAHVSVPLFFTPVPLTLQTLAVLFLGLALGPRAAFASLVVYLIEGAAGLPVFSPHGPGGLLQLAGPQAGTCSAIHLPRRSPDICTSGASAGSSVRL